MAQYGENDETLFNRAAGGDARAFEELILKYEKLILSLAYRMMGNIWDARDVAQESMVKIYGNIHKCRNMRSFVGWITTITNNACIDELRKRKNKRDDSLNRMIETEEGETAVQFESDEPTPEARAIENEKRARIQAAINQLPSKYKTLIVLRDINGLSYEELADISGLSMGTVKSRLSRARAKLAQLLSDEYAD